MRSSSLAKQNLRPLLQIWILQTRP